MTRMRSIALTLGCAAALVAASSRSPLAANTPALDRAPNITLTRLDGHRLPLSDLAGHVVLVDFWASWCPPCRTSFPALDGLYRELHGRGLDVLAVNVDERAQDADAFLAAHPRMMPVFRDPKGEAAAAFRLAAMPTSFLIDRAGRIRYTHTGYTAAVADAYRQEIAALLEEASPR
jgi:thiol-disulfide isomerase/thioredoxin